MELVKPGKYNAVIVEHGIIENKSGDAQVAIRFGFNANEEYRELTWFGSFKKGALEHTLKALLVCGVEGAAHDPAEIGREVSITVDIKPKDEYGDARNVIRWVNKLGGGMGKKMDGAIAASKLEQYSGALMALKEKLGGDKPDSDGLGF